MTEIDISRRGILTAAAATAALAACSRTSADADRAASPGTLGQNPSYGDDPNAGFPAGVPYDPKYLTLMRIVSKGKWDISANHATFTVPDYSGADSPEKQRLDAAIGLLDKFHGAGNEGKQFKHIFTPDPNPKAPLSIVKRNTAGDVDAVDFVGFNFGWQHDIYIWFDDRTDSLQVVQNKTGKHLIEMSAAQAHGESTKLNKSFYAEDQTDAAKAKWGKTGPLILVRNYLRDEGGIPLRDANGQPTTPANFDYSMDIFVEIKRANGKNVVLILDPDTGNGTNFDPIISA